MRDRPHTHAACVEYIAFTPVDIEEEMREAEGIVQGTLEAGPPVKAIFAGSGEMRARCRDLDWATTPLGPVEVWPASLRTATQMVLAAPTAMLLLWGPRLVQIYNDPYRAVIGTKHPRALAQPTHECWPEVVPFTVPIFDAVMQRGEAFSFTDQRLVLERHGAPAEAFFTLSYSPVPDASGAAGGILVTVFETTSQVRDRSDQKAALRDSEERYHALFTSMDEGFCVLQLIFDQHDRPTDFRYIATNPAFARQTGLGTAVGRTFREVIPDAEPSGIEAYGQVALTGEPAHFETHAAYIGRWFDIHAFRVGEPDERRVAVLFNDITERKRSEAERERLLEALEVERSRLIEVIRRAPAFMTVLRGRDYILEVANDAYQQLVRHRGVIGKPLFDAIPEARGQGFEALLDEVLATGKPFIGRGVPVSLEVHPGAAPEERFLDLTYVPLTEPDGTPSGIIALGTDVTEQLLARREVERARDRAERLQALTAALARARTLEDVADVVVADMVVALGARTGALAGRAPEADALVLLRTVGFPETVTPKVGRQALDLRSPLIECFRTQSAIWIEQRDGPDGLDIQYPMIAPIWDVLGVQSAAFVPLIAAGEAVGVISFAFERPRTFDEAERSFLLALGQQAALAIERARLFDAERVARDEAERANRAKSEFLAVMSHELRTPLNAIGGYAELMEMGIRGPVTPQQREDLRRVQTSQRHLLGLINEVLNYAKLETGTVHFDIVDVRVRDALSGAEALVSPQAQAKSLELVVHPCSPRLAARADSEKLRQILVNLLSNAVKFTDAGGRVELSCNEHDDRVEILVRDTGIGIAGDQLERIFEPFVQVRADLTRTAEGTGLGLAISRDLARGMNGDLTVSSAPGKGSTFTLTLPRGTRG